MSGLVEKAWALKRVVGLEITLSRGSAEEFKDEPFLQVTELYLKSFQKAV